jgi:hypothetical protein
MAWAAEMYVMAFSAGQRGLSLFDDELVGLERVVIAAACLVPGTAWLVGGYQTARRRRWILDQPWFVLLTFPFGLFSRRYFLKRADEFRR